MSAGDLLGGVAVGVLSGVPRGEPKAGAVERVGNDNILSVAQRTGCLGNLLMVGIFGGAFAWF